MEWKPFYTGSSKFLSFLSRNALYLLSFCIPVFLLLFLMNQHGFAPFGDSSLYIFNGSEHLSLFTSFANQIQSGNFSFFAQNGNIGSEYYSTILYYLCSPLHLFLAVFPVQTAVYLLHILTVLRIGLSGFFMSLYLTHRQGETRFSKYDITTLIFSLGYSISSYMLVQYNDFMFMDCAMLFPLLMLTYEQLLFQNRRKSFIAVLSCMFFSNYYMTAIICLFLCIHFFTRKKDNFHQACSLFRRLVFSFFSAAAISAITVIPGFYSLYISKITNSFWPEFIPIHDWLSLFSKFMPNNYGSYVMTEVGGSNLYCGLFALILLFFYLMDKKNKLSMRIRNLLFLAILIMFANIESLRYIASFFMQDSSRFNGFGFLICFFVLAISSESMYRLKENPPIVSVLSVTLPFALFLSSTLYAKDYSNRDSLSTSIIFFVIYMLLIVFYRINSINRKVYLGLIIFFSVIELFGNTSKNLSYIKMDTTPVANIYKTDSSTLHALSYNLFDDDFSFGTDFDFCSFLPGDYISTAETASTVFEKQNDTAVSLGIDEKLFTDAGLDISYQCSNNIICVQTSDNIFSLKVKPDTPNAKTPYNRLILTITPDQSGDLYIYTNQLEHIGQVTAGEPFTHAMTFVTSSNLFENYWIHGAYLNENTPELLQQLSCEFTPPKKQGVNAFVTEVDVAEEGTLLFSIPYSKSVRFKVDNSPVTHAKGPQNSTVIPISSGKHTVQISLRYDIFYIGLLVSLFSLLWCLIQTKKQKKECISETKGIFYKIECYIQNHAVALFAFTIPFGILLIACVLFNISPFGIDTFFKNDGSALTIPTLYQSREQLKNGSLFYSWTAGGGSNIFYTLPAMFMNYWLCLIPDAHLLPFVTIIEVIKIGLCGLSMYFYITRRKIGQRMYRGDYRILMFTTAYSLSAYMINMRGFFSWVDILLLFPLILLAMDKLMLEKKKSIYILLLALGILINYNITLYVCVFLVFTFFTYPFRNFKDFVYKGFRFAFSSILSAGMCFFVLFATYMGMQVSPYSADDSVFPTFTFYQSFFDSLKQSFVLSEPIIITTSDGAINLYCGVFCLLLTALYILSVKRNKNKLLKLGFMLFVFFSSNNNLLSYIWNGFHYQTKVPNRYSFLLIFLLLDISIEALYQIKKCNMQKLIGAYAGITTLCIITSLLAKESLPPESAIATLVLLTMFFVLLLLLRHKKIQPLFIKRVFVVIAVAELCINTCYNFGSAEFGRIDNINYNRKITAFLKDEYLGENMLDRVAYLGPVLINQNMVNHVNSLNQFNSFLTTYQRNLGSALGYGVSNNLITAENNLTPFSNAVTNVKYMVVDEYTLSEFVDLEHYTPVASYNTGIILKNDRALPLAYYTPYESFVYSDNVDSAEDFCNGYVKGFFPEDCLFTDSTEIGNVEWSLSDPVNNFVFSENAQEETMYAHLHFEPEKSGEYYYRIHEFFYLGYLEAGKSYDFTLEVTANDTGIMSIYHDDVFQKFYDEASKHTMEITDYSDTHINGTITLPKDGCVYFAIPYERGWTAYVDGKKTELGSFSNGTMFLTTTEGTHDIHLEFRPAGLTVGVAVSLVFVFLYLLVILSEIITKKRSRTSASPEISTEIE
ncbi:MAG: YfhO family protein [Lachnospiraceae bacterium]|nr:YfhO family protein [Lachnospiraceae bacterium]